MAAIPWQIEQWYGYIADVIKRYNIKPMDIWNMDEIGF